MSCSPAWALNHFFPLRQETLVDNGPGRLYPVLNVEGGGCPRDTRPWEAPFDLLLSEKQLSVFACHLQHFQEPPKVNTVWNAFPRLHLAMATLPMGQV